MNEIRWITREELDTLKYDSCVHYATNGHVYGYSWYLDNACEHWDVLVEGDYESVMPLPHTKVLGRKVGKNPTWVRQVGPFSVSLLSKPRIEAFIKEIPASFGMVHYALSGNLKSAIPEGVEFLQAEQYLLSMMVPYESIAARYHPEFTNLLERTYDGSLRVINSLKPEKLVDFYRDHLAARFGFEDDQYYYSMLRIMYHALHRGTGFPTGVVNKAGDLLAVAFFVTSHGKIEMLAGGASKEGEKLYALHFLMDMLIRTHAGRPSQLSFTNPWIPADKAFYEGFGAQTRHFLEIKRNNLNWVQQSAIKIFHAAKNLSN